MVKNRKGKSDIANKGNQWFCATKDKNGRFQGFLSSYSRTNLIKRVKAYQLSPDGKFFQVKE